MNYLTVENLTKSYGEKLLFENITFGVDKGQKVALIAQNGTGKTTLINIITGTEIPDEGNVIMRNGLTISYLKQSPSLNDEATVIDAIFNADNAVFNTVKEYEEILEELAAFNKKNEQIDTNSKSYISLNKLVWL